MEFGDNFVENEMDPAAEFLAREQNELAGLEDELNTTDTSTTALNGTVIPNDITNDFDNMDINSEIEKDFAAQENNPPSPPTVQETPRERREEPEKIKKWREQQQKSLEEKDELEEKKKEEWRLNAKKELDDWYKHHEEHISKTKTNNRNAEKQLVIEDDEKIEPGTEWKRIAKLCDFNKKSSHNTKDASRMKSIILQLKESPKKTKTV